MDQLGLSIAPASGANKEGVVVTEVDGSSDAAQKGHQVGRCDSRGWRPDREKPRRRRQRRQGGSKLGRKAVLMRIKSGGDLRFVAVQLKKG